MKNKYEIRGDVTAIILNSRRYGIVETLISTNKLNRVIDFPYTWFPRFDKWSSSYYVIGNMRTPHEKSKTILLHRWITDAPKDMYVDHIDHETLNNIDSNLRILTNAENQQNRKGPTKNSKSGIRGVHWSKSSNKWHAQIKVKNIVMNFGYFYSIKEAEEVVIEARKKYMPFSQEA